MIHPLNAHRDPPEFTAGGSVSEKAPGPTSLPIQSTAHAAPKSLARSPAPGRYLRETVVQRRLVMQNGIMGIVTVSLMVSGNAMCPQPSVWSGP